MAYFCNTMFFHPQSANLSPGMQFENENNNVHVSIDAGICISIYTVSKKWAL